MQDTPEPPDRRAFIGADSAVAPDVDLRLIVLLCTHAMIGQMVYSMARVTISYRIIELGLSDIWIGVITAASAVLPVLLAVAIGRFVDRGNEVLTVRLGSVAVVCSCLGYRFSDALLPQLILFTASLGMGHTLLMVSQQMLCVRAARNAVGREAAFGHFMVSTAIGQGMGPFIVGWLGGAQRIPPTQLLFGVALAIALTALALSFLLRGRARAEGAGVATAATIPVMELLRTRGVPTLMIASIITVSAQDLLVIFLPLLGAQRGIEVSHIGTMLMIRSITAVVSRLFYPSMIRIVGRVPLTVGTMAAAAIGLMIVASPAPLPLLYVAMAVTGFGLGIAATLSISNMVDISPPGARGMALSLRITGNRVGQVSVPVLASLVAAAMGAGGIFVIMALALASSAATVHVVRRGHR